ncbi:TetR/AcrR family transcriptional regulator [Isoptericola sp. BMS4]|uniref:TetR/AcrR family transcriptional regulator n=1 Tax=Isoptericola sp. BMS4 TaxID=2527875 RepID=UPI0014218ADA|nr:TetR family transcriptional regulator [Isoptericola sp. BMS4]
MTLTEPDPGRHGPAGAAKDGPRRRRMVQGRGADKQRRMVEAAAALLIDDGFAAVTHRRVAEAAGLPQGSASYYFPSSAALVAAAVEAAEDVRATAATERAGALAHRHRSALTVARLLIEVLYAPHVDDTVVTRRLDPMTTAMRDPALQPIMRRSRPRLLAAVRTVLEASGCAPAEPDDVDLLAHLVDAALLTAASAGSARVLDRAAATVARLLERWR